MMKKEYKEAHRIVSDKLGHQLNVDDLVIGYAYSNNIELYRIREYVKRKLLF